MSPSTSSNVDTARNATFKVGLRQLSADFTEVGSTCNARDLGAIATAQFSELLAKLAALPEDKLIDDDPHLVVSARRGRFLVRPSRGKIRLFDAEDSGRSHLELPIAQVPAYLEGADVVVAAPEAAVIDSSVVREKPARTGLVIFLLVLSAAMVGGSAFFTFRSDSIDPDSEYSALPSDQAAQIRQQLPGAYATGKGASSRTITINGASTLTMVETAPDNTVADKREDTFKLMLRSGKTPVARMSHFGPIEIRDAKTLFYAGESYTRQ